jgi:TrmH family RNA methyltransferase
MAAVEKITSAQNARIKNLKKLEKASERREQGLILIEGLRELVLASRAGYELHDIFICGELVETKKGDYTLQELLNQQQTASVFYITKLVYDSLAYRETTEGVVATAKPKEQRLVHLKLPENPLLLIIEGAEKPGNIGAMLRTCDAAGVDAVILCDSKTDIYNPNVIRSSVGTVFTNQIAVCSSEEALGFLQQHKITVCAGDAGAKKFHYGQNFKQAVAIVVGAEDTGLSRIWTDSALQQVKIPMLGKIDSLNVSVSAAVLLYEARRQRMML